VAASGEKLDVGGEDAVDEAVLLGDPAGPQAMKLVLEGLRLSLSIDWIPLDVRHQLEDPVRDARIGSDPVLQVLQERHLDDDFAARVRG
jgi:hypothetical protein